LGSVVLKWKTGKNQKAPTCAQIWVRVPRSGIEGIETFLFTFPHTIVWVVRIKKPLLRGLKLHQTPVKGGGATEDSKNQKAPIEGIETPVQPSGTLQLAPVRIKKPLRVPRSGIEGIETTTFT
jgi:hypothetical protein